MSADNQKRIHLSPPHVFGRERELLLDALESNWIAPVGPYLNQFEEALRRRVGAQHAVAVVSGTAALHLALRHLDLRPDDEVWCSTLTFCASANPIAYEGARPVFVDCDEATWCLDPNLLADQLAEAAAAGSLPRAIVAVDLLGHAADLGAINDAASRYEVPVIEDAAEALGATYHGESVGSQTWASFFSFNGNKIVTTSGGGALCSADEELIRHARHLATQAREPASYYEHREIGFNYRLSNLLAAVGCAQLETLDERVAARRRVREYYRRHLADLPGVAMMPEPAYGESCYWLTAVTIEPQQFGVDCEQLRQCLENDNIEARRIWKPLHLQPVFAQAKRHGGAVAERIFNAGLCLPSGSSLTDEDLERIVRAIRSARQS